jgi:hypothetical protein
LRVRSFVPQPNLPARIFLLRLLTELTAAIVLAMHLHLLLWPTCDVTMSVSQQQPAAGARGQGPAGRAELRHPTHKQLAIGWLLGRKLSFVVRRRGREARRA